MAEVRGLWWRVCKTVGSAYVGSNPTPATHAKCQVSPGVSAGLSLVCGERSADRSPQGSGLGWGRSAARRAPGAAGLRLLPFPMRSQPRRPLLRLAGRHYGAAHHRTRHGRCHRCAASSAAPQTAPLSVTERTGPSPLPPRRAEYVRADVVVIRGASLMQISQSGSTPLTTATYRNKARSADLAR